MGQSRPVRLGSHPQAKGKLRLSRLQEAGCLVREEEVWAQEPLGWSRLCPVPTSQLSFSSHICLVGVGGPVPSDRASPEAAGSVGRELCLSHWLLGEAGQRKGKDRG